MTGKECDNVISNFTIVFKLFQTEQLTFKGGDAKLCVTALIDINLCIHFECTPSQINWGMGRIGRLDTGSNGPQGDLSMLPNLVKKSQTRPYLNLKCFTFIFDCRPQQTIQN